MIIEGTEASAELENVYGVKADIKKGRGPGRIAAGISRESMSTVSNAVL